MHEYISTPHQISTDSSEIHGSPSSHLPDIGECHHHGYSYVTDAREWLWFFPFLI